MDKDKVREISIAADLHTHTIASGHAYSTLGEMAKAAAEKGLDVLGIADHGPAMPGGPHRYYFGNLKSLPPEINGVEIYRGVEANILDSDGRLDLPEFYLRSLDYVLAGLHFICYPGGSKEKNTKAVLRTMDNPYVDGIVHPGNPEYELDYEKIVKKAAQKNILIEINNNSLRGGTREGSEKNCRRVALLAKEWGCSVLVSSDAHFYTEVGSFKKALKLLVEAGLKDELILNTSKDKISRFLASKGKKRFAP